MSLLYFEINNKNYTTYEVNGTTVYEIQDFYKYPDKVTEFISNIKPFYHKTPLDIGSSLNGRKFRDMRHRAEVMGMHLVTDFLSELCGQKPIENSSDVLLTNYFRMLDSKFNQYEDNYWWPHIDDGYTSLVYLNTFSYPGTNLYQHKIHDSPSSYKELDKTIWDTTTEHITPWQPKSDWKLNHTIQAEYNKLVLFDGYENVHSMNVDSNLFEHKLRLNQVIFFAPIHRFKFTKVDKREMIVDQ
tara:strand:+ start:8679 stop:9407 length:729 start_codon:yes stop_codon:yes gene_type:complete